MSVLHRSARRLSRFGAWVLNTTIVLCGVSVLAFILTCLTPGDLAENLLTSKGIPPTADMVAATRADLGLDRPLVEQYFTWLGKLLTGDLGMSLSAGTQISTDFAMRTPLTLALTLASLIGAWLIAIPVAMTAAAKKGGAFDRIARFLSYVGSALPGFVVALTVLYIFSLKLRLFPISATRDAHGLAMPVITMIIATCGWYTRQIRAIAVEEYDKPYVDGLRVRGMTEVRIAGHVLRNIAAPLVTLAGNSFGSLLAGSAVVEAIFNWHGLGQYALGAITMKDYPVIQAYVVWCAFAFLVSNALADFAAFLLDPRLTQHDSRQQRQAAALQLGETSLTIQHVETETLANARRSRSRQRKPRSHNSRLHWWLLLSCIALIGVAGVAHRLLTPHDPYQTQMSSAVRSPSSQHLLGTDMLGRDVFARVLAGIGPTLSIALVVVALALLIGTLVGVCSALAGGAVDAFLQRLTAVFQSFPEFILALSIAAMLKPGPASAVLALTIAYWPRAARYARILTMQLKESPFIHIARMNGVPTHRIVARHLVPNIGSPLLVIAASDIGSVVLNLATLSFVGLGMPQPTSEWGTMISEGRLYLQVAPWLVWGPGVALFLMTFCFNLFADTSQEILAVSDRPSSIRTRKTTK